MALFRAFHKRVVQALPRKVASTGYEKAALTWAEPIRLWLHCQKAGCPMHTGSKARVLTPHTGAVSCEARKAPAGQSEQPQGFPFHWLTA